MQKPTLQQRQPIVPGMSHVSLPHLQCPCRIYICILLRSLEGGRTSPSTRLPPSASSPPSLSSPRMGGGQAVGSLVHWPGSAGW